MRVSQSAVATPATAATPYDFRRPLKLSREHHRALQIVFETFARQAASVLTSGLRTPCRVTLAAVEQQPYSEYVDSLGELSHLTKFSAEPLAQPGLLQLGMPAALSFVDLLLGGPGDEPPSVRALTGPEQAVVAGLAGRLVAEVRYAFSSLVVLDPALAGVEQNPQLARVATASEAVVVARFELQHGTARHALSLCLSFAGLLPHLSARGSSAAMSDRERALRQAASADLLAGFQEVPMEVSVRFRATTADPLDLARLAVGDVVRLDHPAQAPLDVTAADVVFAHAAPGSHGRRLACRVVATPLQETR